MSLDFWSDFSIMIQRDRGFLSLRFSRAMNSICQVIYSDKHEISPSLSSWPMKARHGSAHPIFEDLIGVCVCESCQSCCLAHRTVMSARYKQVRKRFCEVVEPNEHASVSRHPFWWSRFAHTQGPTLARENRFWNFRRWTVLLQSLQSLGCFTGIVKSTWLA